MENNGMKNGIELKPRTSVRYRYVRRDVPALPQANVGTVALRDSYIAPKRDYKKIIGGVFLAVLFILIFFSKTVYSYNLPVVTAVKPSNGRLSKLEMSTGIANWSHVENLYAAVGGKVDEVLVKEGETVSAGQAIYRLSFDKDEAERRLREIENNRSKLQNDIQSINLKLNKTSRYISELAGEVYEADEPDEADELSSYELDVVSAEIRKAKAELTDVRERHEDGNADDVELERARYNLQILYLKYDEIERKLAEQKEKNEKTLKKQEEKSEEALEEKEKSRASRLKDYESDVATLKLDLQQKNIELNSLSIQEEPYRKALEDFEAYAVISAPTDGTVISLNAVKGETMRSEQLVATVGSGGTFEVECNVSLDNNFVIVGDVVELSNSSHTVNGTVIKVTPAVQNKLVTIEVDDSEVTSGETFDITFKKDSDTVYTLVPNGALNQDNDGYFLNQIKRRDGILGKEYYLERLDVYIGDSDSKNTAIVQGVTFFEPIAQISDKPIESGDVISLKNVGDFFEN